MRPIYVSIHHAMSLICERVDASPVPLITSASEAISFKPHLGCYMSLYPSFGARHFFLMICNVINAVTSYLSYAG